MDRERWRKIRELTRTGFLQFSEPGSPGVLYISCNFMLQLSRVGISEAERLESWHWPASGSVKL
jgi:hypothetical protein